MLITAQSYIHLTTGMSWKDPYKEPFMLHVSDRTKSHYNVANIQGIDLDLCDATMKQSNTISENIHRCKLNGNISTSLYSEYWLTLSDSYTVLWHFVGVKHNHFSDGIIPRNQKWMLPQWWMIRVPEVSSNMIWIRNVIERSLTLIVEFVRNNFFVL